MPGLLNQTDNPRPSLFRTSTPSVDPTVTATMNTLLPSIELLEAKAKRRMPGFAYDYLAGGCLAEVNLHRNTADLRAAELIPFYLRDYPGACQKTELFGRTYDSPFGIAPVGLQGLMWPKSCEILARTAKERNIPFVLSTVSTASIEKIGEITGGDFWFQLYHPAEDSLRNKLLERAAAAGCHTLVLLADTPTFGYRPKEIRNGLSVPPKMTARNVWQMCLHPTWSFSQLAAGIPEFKTLKPYIPDGTNMKHLGLFMNKTFSGRLNVSRIRAIRDLWQGRLIVKGVVCPEDAVQALSAGVDGLIVSNHGGRQLDQGQSTVKSLAGLVREFGGKTTIMMDGGIRSGSDIAVALANGAQFTFIGRAAMFGICAMGARGGNQVVDILQKQLQQVMEQLGCERIADLPRHLA
jgi:L-lactate dehydrogenase (cytochrome)